MSERKAYHTYRFSKLYAAVEPWLSDQEVDQLAFQLGVDIENVAGPNTTKVIKLQQLQVHLWQTNRYFELVEAIDALRPQLDTTAFGGTPPTAVSVEAEPEPPPEARKTAEYENFTLHIRGKDANGRYPIEARHDYAGGAEVSDFLPDFDPAAPPFKAWLTYLTELVAEGEDARALGAQLKELLFPYEIWSFFNSFREKMRAAGHGIRLRLRIDPPELNRLPWEYCYDAKNRLYFSNDLETPLVRYISRPYTPQPLAGRRLRILLVMAAPQGVTPLDDAHEQAQIEEALSPLGGSVSLDVLKRATVERLLDRVETFQPQVIHFVGHGALRNGEGVILLENEDGQIARLSGSQLANALRRRGVKLVILNACETAVGSAADAFLGVAPALMLADIPAVLAMQFKIPDWLALRLTRALYRQLARRAPIDRAVTEMRIAIAAGSSAEEQVYWGIPVLFMRGEDGQLWRAD